MKTFRFPLERALHWRTTQCELEEAKLSRLTSQRSQLLAAAQQVSHRRAEASKAISSESEIRSSEFQTVSVFHASMEQQKAALQKRARDVEVQIAAQMRQTADARRKRKLLEILREKRLAEWTSSRNAEDEAAAADAWLTRFVTERYTTENASVAPR